MTRAVAEWSSDNHDAAIPPRVKLRIFDRQHGQCARCTARLYPGRFQFDHAVSLINGGTHSEGNLQVLCDLCHKQKTRSDVAQKSKSYRVRAKSVGIRLRNRPS